MLYVYRRGNAPSARLLADALGAHRLHHLDDRLQSGDVIVAWGESVPALAGIATINGPSLKAKLTDARLLEEADVPTIEVSETLPQVVPVVDPAQVAGQRLGELISTFPWPVVTQRCQAGVDAAGTLRDMVQAYLDAARQPAPPPSRFVVGDMWIPRVSNHRDGIDLREPPAEPDFWVKREPTVREYRVHSFLGRSIRAGVKVRTSEPIPPGQEWIRAGAGWRISYDGVRPELRRLAARAVAALGLQFGAVDIGERADGSFVVFEVNRAPLLEGGTVNAYASAIQNWMSGNWSMRDVAN